MLGEKIYSLAQKLWPINRSITGDGVRKTLSIIRELIPCLEIVEVPSGTRVFDWTVPQEWRLTEGYIVTPDGKKICDSKKNNLHVVGYSSPVNTKLSLPELRKHLYSLPDNPTGVPYITSYYKPHWGFCISHNDLLQLQEGVYEVVIDSELFNGSMTYGEVFLKGKSKKEVFLSTYVCHPSMANNELSGPCVTAYLVNELAQNANLKYSYRIVFSPETIGAITYLSSNINKLKENVFAAFNVTCVGDDRTYSYLPSRQGNSISDVVAKHVLKNIFPNYNAYSWLDRGSDERQYCAPGVDLPMVSIMRTMYGKYDEYHTSLDTLGDVVSPEGLMGGYLALSRAIDVIERNVYPMVTTTCEPNLGKRGLYPTVSTEKYGGDSKLISDIISLSDGLNSLIDIAEILKCAAWDLFPVIDKLIEHGLIRAADQRRS